MSEGCLDVLNNQNNSYKTYSTKAENIKLQEASSFDANGVPKQAMQTLCPPSPHKSIMTSKGMLINED